MIRKHDDIVGSLFQDIAHLIRSRIDRDLQPHGLTRLKWLAIGLIQKSPGLTQSELARKLELKPAATGKLVDRLEERALVVRQPDDTDRRVHRLYLTEKSDSLLEELEPVGESIREDVLQDFSDRERKQLERALQKLKRRLTTTALLLLALTSHAASVPWASALNRL